MTEHELSSHLQTAEALQHIVNWHRLYTKGNIMLALRKIETVDSSGKVQIDIPQEFGSKVEILILPVHENVNALDTSVDDYFLSNAFEDDLAEDAIWQKYIAEEKS